MTPLDYAAQILLHHTRDAIEIFNIIKSGDSKIAYWIK